jgi:hypothetical protein
MGFFIYPIPLNLILYENPTKKGLLISISVFLMLDGCVSQQSDPCEENVVLKDSTKYSIHFSGCEKRAHAISLILKGRKIKHYKIWNFDPSLISLFYKQEKPSVTNRAGLSPVVSWRYHVAILLLVREKNNKISSVVIDPSISDELLSEKMWLQLQNSPNSFYTYLDPQWYNYATTDKFTFTCEGKCYSFPPCSLGTLTGDFFENDGVSLSQMWIEEALAINQLGMTMIEKLIKSEPPTSSRRKAFTELVENFDALTSAIKGEKVPDNILPYLNLFEPYQKEYIDIRNSWKAKLDVCRQSGIH